MSYKEVKPLVEKFIEDLNQANAEALRKGWDTHLKDPAFFDLDAPSHIRRRASDRSALIRMASTMPAGSEGRRAILAGLINRKSGGHVGDSVKAMLEGAHRTTVDAQKFLSRNGVSGALARSIEDATTALEKAVQEAESTGL